MNPGSHMAERFPWRAAGHLLSSWTENASWNGLLMPTGVILSTIMPYKWWGWAAGERGRVRVMALRDIRVGGVFVFIRFYGLGKYCHAYQLRAEQMAQCSRVLWLYAWMCGVRLTVTTRERASGRSTGREGSGWQLLGRNFRFPFVSALHPWSASRGQN